MRHVLGIGALPSCARRAGQAARPAHQSVVWSDKPLIIITLAKVSTIERL